MNSSVKLYLRVRMPDGSHPYLKPVIASNGRLRPNYALYKGKSTHFPGGTYYLRYQFQCRRIWEPAGNDASVAVVNQQKKIHALKGVALGIAEPGDIQRASSERVDTPMATEEKNRPDSPRTKLREAIAEYLADTAMAKAKRTSYAYARALKVFATICPRVYMEEIDRRDVLNYLHHLKASGNVPRTIANYSGYLKIFFNHRKIKWPLERTDRVKYTDKTVSAYRQEEILRLLRAAGNEEAEMIQFFLFTGARDQEVQFATWRDIDFSAKTFTITEKLDLGWSPKDAEEGSIPIPDALVEVLRKRRERNPGTRLIFPTAQGKPNGHFLRTLKSLAFRIGMNCGGCYNKKGQCCSNKPVCKRFELHRFRKTFATMHHEAGVPVRTISRWLRHSDLETTLRYLASSDDRSERTREQVNRTFAEFGQPGCVA